jgi:chromosome segregation ATPase
LPNSLNKNKKIADKEQAEKKIIDQQEELNEFASVSKSLSNNPTTAESLKTEITAIAQKVSNWKLEKEKLVDSNWQQQDEAAKQIDSLEKKLVEIQILKLNQFKTDPPVEVVIEQSKKRCAHL